MKRIFIIAILVLIGAPCFAQDEIYEPEPSWIFTFDSEDEFTEYPGGFVGADAGTLILGGIPSDPNGLTDGQGAMILTAPGQIELLVFPTLDVGENLVFIRASVQSTGDGAAIGLAALDGSMDGSIGTNIPANSGIYKDGYRRITLLYDPPGTTITPAFQVANSSSDDSVLIYLDNLEIFTIPRDVNVSSNFLYGESTQPVDETITIPLDLPSGAKPLEMVRIPNGTFTMGSPSNEQDRYSSEGPQHQVTISSDFYMGRYEVTQAQWEAVMGSNPASSYGVGNDYPVYYVSWNDCQTFISKLNEMGYGTFRLPTEAEWEYACRAGTETRFYWGDDPSYTEIKDYCWYSSNNSSYGTKAVGQKLPNSLGLYDMSGNVYEWCQDWYGSYSSNSQIDPTGPSSGSARVLRGGYWHDGARLCRSASRGISSPGNRFYGLGVRLLRSYP